MSFVCTSNSFPGGNGQLAKEVMDHEPGSSFKVFPKLPNECQLMIWSFVARTPQVIRWGRVQVPVVFHICQNSRHEALKSRTLVMLPSGYNREAGFYVNAEHDILYHRNILPPPPELYAQSEVDFYKRSPRWVGRYFVRKSYIGVSELQAYIIPSWSRPIKHLAIPLVDGHAMAERSENLWLKMQVMFPNLEELIFMLKPNLKQRDHMVGDLEEIVIEQDQAGNLISTTPALETNAQGSMISEIVCYHYLHKCVGFHNFFSIRFMRSR